MKVLVLCLCLVSASAFAKGKTFEERKAQKLERINKRLTSLQEHKSCVEAAADKEAMGKCREGMKMKRKEMKK